MGYVLPVSHFQYQDYKRRITPDKQNQLYVDCLQKPVFEKNDQDMISSSTYKQKDLKGNGRDVYGRDDDTLYAEITGKGRYVNVWV